VFTETGAYIEMDGIRLDPNWTDAHLSRCLTFYPELPSVRQQSDGSIEHGREWAFIEFAVSRGWVQKRIGMRAIWINEHSPASARKELGL